MKEPLSTTSPTGMTRRSFLKSAAAAAVAPAILPSSVFARPAPSDRLLMGCIGVGRQGLADMQELIYRGLEAGARVVAVADVDAHRREHAQWLVDKIYAAELGADRPPACAGYHDFRELLARPDIDGVTVVTPDHWHAAAAVAAANAGKDIYLEKPMTYTIAEGRKLVAAVRRNKRILQVGSQQRSGIYFRTGCELIRNNRIGRLKTIRVILPPDAGTGDPGPMPVPKNLDYDFWLGPTPEAPFSEDRTHPQSGYDRPGWIQTEPYGRGMITNWGAHMIDIAQWGNDTENTGPVEIEGRGEFPQRGVFNVHTMMHAEALYANGVRLLVDSQEPGGVRFEGEDGWIDVQRDKLVASNPALLREKVGDGGVKLYVSNNHMRNFLECIRSRKEPAAPVEVGHRSNSACVLIHIAMRLGRKLRWDPKAERFLGDEEANGWLDYEHRAPWTIQG